MPFQQILPQRLVTLVRRLPWRYQPYAPLLPLRWSRFILSALATLTCIIVGNFAYLVFINEDSRVNQIHQLASQHGLSVQYSDRQFYDLSIFLMLSLVLIGIFTSNPFIFLLQDLFHIIPPRIFLYTIAPFLRLPHKIAYKVYRNVLIARLSQDSMAMQSITIVFFTVVYAGIMSGWTFLARRRGPGIVFTRDGEVVGQQEVSSLLSSIGFATMWWDMTFIRNIVYSCFLPLLFSIPLSFVSLAAWYISIRDHITVEQLRLDEEEAIINKEEDGVREEREGKVGIFRRGADVEAGAEVGASARASEDNEDEMSKEKVKRGSASTSGETARANMKEKMMDEQAPMANQSTTV